MATIDFGKIVNRSFYLTKKHKWLWVYGLIIAAASSGYSNFNFPGGGSDSSEINNTDPTQLMDTIQNQEKVLGDATTWLTQSFASVPLTTWLLIGVGLLAMLVVAIALNWVLVSFVKSALIAGVNDGDEGKDVDLRTTGKQGWVAILPFIRLKIRIIAVTLAGAIVLGVIAVMFALLFAALKISFLMILVGLILVVLGAIGIVLLAMVEIYAERLIVIKKMSAMDAFKRAFSLSKGHFLPTVVMGIINMVLGCAGGCIMVVALLALVGIPSLIVLAPSFASGVENFTMPSVPAILFLVLLGILSVVGLTVFRAGIVVFTFSNWTLLFKQVMENEQE